MMKRLHSLQKRLSIIAISVLASVSCIDQNNPESKRAHSSTPTPTSTSDKGEKLATVDNIDIFEADIEQSIQLKSFDLAWAQYELTRDALTQHLSEYLKARGKTTQKASIDVLLEPPTPPRLEAFDPYATKYVKRSQPQIGKDSAPVELSIFCNYQSIHCARMAKTYAQLNTIYSEQIKFVYYDFPQKFHRYSALAAQAARCAYQYQKLPAYQSALWASQNELAQERLIQIAQQLGLNDAEFKACMAQTSVMESVKNNMNMATEIGLNSVPITLINGLYLNGPKTVDQLRYYIDKELERSRTKKRLPVNRLPENSIQEVKSPLNIPQSELALRFEGIYQGLSRAGDEADLQAQIRHIEYATLNTYNENDALLEDVFLVLIESDRVVIENNGSLEFLPLEKQDQIALAVEPSDIDPSEQAETTQHQSSSDHKNLSSSSETISEYQEIPDDVLAQDLEYTARPIVASAGVLPLSKEWIDEQLLNQSELESGFTNAAHEVEGKHLLKLKGIEDSSFYQTLGLREGDAVMRVNGEWVHEQNNNLFNVLENEDHLSIVLMRKGLPVHLEYAIR